MIVHRNKTLRNYQTFLTDNWLGGFYGSPAVLGTKGGGPWAAAWAVMHHLGDDGYERLTAAARRAALELADAIEATPGLRLLARPDTTLVAFTSADDSLDPFAVADAVAERGWYIDRQGPPRSLHCTVNAVHDGLIPSFVADLHSAVEQVRASASTGGMGAYGTVE